MSGRNPPLYCIFTLIAMQGHQKNIRKNQRQCSTPSHMVVVIYITKAINTKPLKFDFTVDEGKEWLNPSRDKN